MDRRDFLKTSGAAAAAVTIATSTADAATTTDVAKPALVKSLDPLRLAMPWPQHTAGFGDSAARLARRIEAATGGRMRIELVEAPNGGLEAVMLGDADLYHGNENHHLSFHPALAYFAGLPYFCGLEPHDHVAWLTVGGGQELWDEVGADLGVKPLLAGHSGRAPGLWSTSAIDTVADLKGKPVYILGLAREVVRAFGAEPVTLPASGIKDALAQGHILAAEWGSALASVSLGIPEVARHQIGLGINNAGTALTLGVRRSLWDRLPAMDQAAIEACAAEECRLSLSEARAHELMLRDLLRETRGVKFDSLPGDLMAVLSEAADAVVARNGEVDDTTRRIHANYMGFRKAVTGLDAPRAPAAV